MNKIAKVTAFFWIMKICATTLGETAGDLLSMTMHVGYAVSSIILIIAFLISVVAQLRAARFHPVLYWTVILTTSTAGTTMSDFMDRTLGLGYAKGSLILVSCLLVVLAAWRFSEKTLSVDNVQTAKGEMFYWTAILFSNTLGTALGDFLADDSGLGFLGGAALIGALLGVIVLAVYFTRLNRVMLFWVAFVLTRPFGATFGDFLTKPAEKGGVNFGTIGSSLILASLLALCIVYTSAEEKRRALRRLSIHRTLRNALHQWWLRRPLLPEEEAVLAAVHEKYGKHARDLLFFVPEKKPPMPARSSAVLRVWGNSGDGPWVHLTNHAAFIKLGHTTLAKMKEELP